MNDSTIDIKDHTKKYQISPSHLEHRYIQQCTDGLELEQIYKELISKKSGRHEILEELTLDRIRKILPNSQILLPAYSSLPKSVINNQHDLTVLKSNEEWSNLEEKISREFNSDDEDHLGEQHRLNADTAFKLNNYQQAIDLYTKSLSIEENSSAYMNRAIAYYQLNRFDAAIQDCFEVLLIDSKNIDALSHRAQCYLEKKQYEQAKRDFQSLLDIDPNNSTAQIALNTILSFGKMDNNDDDHTESPAVISLSPSTFNHDNNNNQYEISSSNDGDDDLAIGDEAGCGSVDNVSDDDGQISRNLNASPVIYDASPTQDIPNQKSMITPTDHSIGIHIDRKNKQNDNEEEEDVEEDDEDDEYDLYTGKPKNKYSSFNQNTLRHNNQKYMQSTSMDDIISNSSFGSIIQSWLRDLVALQPNRHYNDRPWSKYSRPWSLDKIQRDIDRYNRYNDYKNTIEVTKKLLQNGVLDYHNYAEYIAETLSICSHAYLKSQDYSHAIQYASETLQYNKNDGTSLWYRAKAFENENLLLFSYADYARLPSHDFNYNLTQHAREKIIKELNSTEDETWREKLPNNQNDDERYLIYLKQKTNYSEENSYQWYLSHADRLYFDACFVLAIRFYTICIELQPQITDVYLKRAACYIKVFEPQKVINDCDVILKEEKNNLLALYYKACAYKVARDFRLYELTLKEYIKLQPNNQIILAEYYTYRHEQIPRKKRRIRTKSINDYNLSYEELEQIRLEKIIENSSIDSSDIKEQCSFLLHLQSFNSISTKFVESIINISRLMMQAEENYQHEHKSMILPFSYIDFCFNILIELTKSPQIDLVVTLLEENYRILLDELISYYSSRFDDGDKLNQLKRL